MKEDLPAEHQTHGLTEFLRDLNVPQLLLGPAGKAISRLIAGATDIPAAWLESYAVAIRDKTAAKQVVSKAIASAAAKLATQDEALVERAVQNLIWSELRRQENREAIARKTIEFLEAGPSKESATRSSDDQISIDDDWLNVFERYARDASSERMQSLWARILAGQIRYDLKFSLRAMRFVSELDQQIALLFQSYGKLIINRNSIPVPHEDYGSETDKLLMLQEAGLIDGVGGFLGITLSAQGDNQFAFFETQGRIVGIEFLNGKSSHISCVSLTKLGQEMLALLDEEFHTGAFQEVMRRVSFGQSGPLGSPNVAKLFNAGTPAEIFWMKSQGS